LQDYIQLAVAYYDANDMAGARRHINNALAINNRSADAYNVLALILQREGDLDLADETFRRAIALDRENPRVRNNYAAFLFGQARYAEAYEQLQVVSNNVDYEGRAGAFENLGRSALMLGRKDDAQRAFERALQLNSNLYLSALELTQLRIDKQEWSFARRSYDQYLTIKEFYNLPFNAQSLWIGIQLESHSGSRAQLEIYTTLLTTLFQNSPEYQLYQSAANAN
jgi:type IV pilus assembly protein PilF